MKHPVKLDDSQKRGHRVGGLGIKIGGNTLRGRVYRGFAACAVGEELGISQSVVSSHIRIAE